MSHIRNQQRRSIKPQAIQFADRRAAQGRRALDDIKHKAIIARRNFQLSMLGLGVALVTMIIQIAAQ